MASKSKTVITITTRKKVNQEGAKTKPSEPVVPRIESDQINLIKSTPESYRQSLYNIVDAINSIHSDHQMPLDSIKQLISSQLHIIHQLRQLNKRESEPSDRYKYSSPDDDVTKMVKKIFTDGKVQFQCSYRDCTDTSRTFIQCRNHIKKQHLGIHRTCQRETILLTECEFCGDHFLTRKIWKHMKTNHKDKPQLVYKCFVNKCTFAHEYQRDWLIHMKSEHPEVPYFDSQTTPKVVSKYYSMFESDEHRLEYLEKEREKRKRRLKEKSKAETMDSDEDSDATVTDGHGLPASEPNDISFEDAVNANDWADRMAQELIGQREATSNGTSAPLQGPTDEAEKNRREALSLIGKRPLDHKMYSELVIKPDFEQICKSCNKTFTKNSEFVVHNPCYGLRNNCSQDLKSWNCEIKCEVCGSSFQGAFSLKNHILYHLDPLWGCTKCDSKMYNEGEARSHVNRHVDFRPFYCMFKVDGKECQTDSRDSSTVERHIYSEHLKSYPYNCDQCPKGTTKCCKFKDLEKHMEIKHNKTMKCPIPGCNVNYGLRQALRSHIMSKHPEVDFDFSKLAGKRRTRFVTGKVDIKRGSLVLVEEPESRDVVEEKRSKLTEGQQRQVAVRRATGSLGKKASSKRKSKEDEILYN